MRQPISFQMIYFLFLLDYKILGEMLQEEAKLIEEEDYCDEAQLMIEEYSRHQTVSFQEQLQFINEWATDQSRSSMLITGAPASGKKTLINQFLKDCKQLHPNWLFIYHFASITPVYSNILYKIMITLRNHFKIEQKVDLNQEKLRRYFKYWLELTSDFLQKEYLGYNRQEIPKVVIIIEGIDLCIDPKGNPVEPQFWLPSAIPHNIKLILTTNYNANIIVNNSIILSHQLTRQNRKKIIERYSPKVLQWSQLKEQTLLYALYGINEMVKRKETLQAKGQTWVEILLAYIRSVSLPDFSEDIIKSLLYTLVLTRKGLRSKQICKIVSITCERWQYFLKHFSFLIVESKGYFIVCNRSAREAILRIVDPRAEKARLYRNSICKTIKKESINLRNLEEIVFQLLLNQSYTQLKEVISRIENFVTLYTPFSKQLLCQCWSRLEQLQQFDPVFEYNKAIEAYKSHYYPKEEDLYKIIFQISMFFKEYAQFQNSKTPAFRHPFIKGETDHLQAIGILQELNSLAMVGKCKVYKLKPLEKISSTRIKPLPASSKAQMKDQNQKIDILRHRGDNIQKLSIASHTHLYGRTGAVKSKHSQKRNQQALEEERSDVSTPSNEQTSRQTDIIQEAKGINIQQINVGIISNQEKFKHHFLGQMKEYLEKYIVPYKKNIHKEKLLAFQSDQSDEDDQSCNEKGLEKELRIDAEKIKDSLVLKGFKEYLQESYHKNGQQVQYYYYKQWIWLQFPWLCQTVKHVYSVMVKECIPGSIHFMAPAKEFGLIKEVLKIARSAKENKMGIYTEKKIEIHCIKPPNRYDSLSKLAEIPSQQQSKVTFIGNSTSRKVQQNQNSNLYKVNLKSLDQQIYKEKREESKFRDRGYKDRKTLKGEASLPNLHLFMTQASNKDSRLLPVLKKSKFLAETASKKNKQKQNMQNTRDYTVLIRKYNELKHENEMLVEKIEEVRRLQMQKVDKSNEDITVLNEAIGQLQGKKNYLQKSHKNQIELRKKLEVIIKICDLNKMYGSQTDYLSNYLESLKKMIQLQDDNVKQIKSNIFNDIEVAKVTLKELRAKKKELRTIKQEAIVPYASLSHGPNSRAPTELGLQAVEEEFKQMNRFGRQRSQKKGTKTKDRRLFTYQDYETLQSQLGIVYGSDSNEDKIKEFADKQEKIKVLRLKNGELSRQFDLKKKQLQAMRIQSKIHLQGNTRALEIKTANLVVQKRKELNVLRNRNMLLANANRTLNEQQNQ